MLKEQAIPNIRLMTRETLNYLQTRSADANEALIKIAKEGSGHQRANLHDDASSENALNLARAVLINIGDLSAVQIIAPRIEIDTVGLGNRVTLQYDPEEQETILLLDHDDTVYQTLEPKVISIRSPVGQAVVGRRAGETVKVVTDEKQNSGYYLYIVEILPGNFEP